jgi:2-polyprenyl-3-methyl-5-hydroxy-6-metoxy-1,4-benzoquinol methylase
MTLEEVFNCPLCQGTHLITLHQSKDHNQSGILFPVKQCVACSFTFTSPRPPESNAGQFYQSSNYISHQTTAVSLFDRLYLIIRSFTLRWKYQLVKPYCHGSLLDVGCGTGTFLTYCQKQGIRVTGIEPSDARKTIQGITTYQTLSQAPQQSYSVITLWHVLEHIYELKETIGLLKSNLEENGTIFIAVPNRLSQDAHVYGKYWAAWDVPRHIWHFSSDNMSQLMKQSGLQVKEIIPMKLDAYYVALLSEKYRGTGKLGFVRATWVALLSNFSARKTGEYSSLIYRITR